MLAGMKYDNPATSLKTEMISVAVPLDLKLQIRRAADRNHETAADFVRKAVSDRLARTVTPPRSRGGR